MLNLLFISIGIFCFGIVLFLILPILHIFLIEFKCFENIKNFILQSIRCILLSAFLIFVISVGFLIVKNIRSGIKEKEDNINFVIKNINDKNYKVYKIYFQISELSFKKYFINDEQIKNIIISQEHTNNETIIFYFTKNEINDISNIDLTSSLKINASIVKKINIHELKEILKSTNNSINLEKIKEDLKNDKQQISK